ncbi:MAG: dockerin type I repeat-containing protein, partial [Bacilli bacterium]|nr:dockerin type I repeat-containing protein [Bacilli bacterium]
VIYGDVSGDGKVNALDLLQVQKSILGSYDLTKEQRRAGDTSGDGKVNALDLLQMQKSILGSYEKKQ